MASNINTTDIDVEFPVPGQDNDSQGFRDNFTTISDNFIAAKAEIETLQSDTVKLNVNNTFLDQENGTASTLINANLKGNTEQYYTPEGGNVSTTHVVDFDDGGYQVITLAGTTTFSFDGWPTTGRYAKIRLHIESTGSYSIALQATTVKNDGDNFWSNPSIAAGETHIIDVWTYQNGSTIYANYVGAFAE